MTEITDWQRGISATSHWLLQATVCNGTSRDNWMDPLWSIKLSVTLVPLHILSVALLTVKTLSSCVFVHWALFLARRAPVRVWALSISPLGVIHSGRATDCVSTAHSFDCLASIVKQSCALISLLNMQRCLKGMLIGAFITTTKKKVCAEFILAVQVTYKSALAMDDKITEQPSSQKSVGWVGTLLIVVPIMVKYLFLVDLTVIVDAQ